MKSFKEKVEEFFNDSQFVTSDFWTETPSKGKWMTIGAHMGNVFEFAVAFHKHALDDVVKQLQAGNPYTINTPEYKGYQRAVSRLKALNQEK
jgi:hypothetical protein